MSNKRESFPVSTLDECFESIRRANASYRAADPRTACSLAKVLGFIAEQAIGLDEQNPDRLRIYIEALTAAQAVRNDVVTPRHVAIARARMHRGGPPATVLASAKSECWSPYDLVLADASEPGTRAHFHVNQSGRMTLEIRLLQTLDVELPYLYAMSSRQLVHAPTGRLLVDGGMLAPLARIDVPAGWYDVVLCTFVSQTRLLILVASTDRRSHDPPFVDTVPTIGLL